MNTKTFTYLLANPQTISAEQRDELTIILDKYPYFQSARALQLKGLKNDNSFLYNDALKVTAAYTSDRDILFEYITSSSFIQNEISEVIQQHDDSVIEMDVISEDISEQVSIEIDNKIKAELKKAEAILNPDLFKRKVDSVKKIAEEIQQPEEILGIDKPLDFSNEDSHSFSEWLKLTTATPIIRDNNKVDKSGKEEIQTNISQQGKHKEKEHKFQLIEKFIQGKPKLHPKDTISENINLAASFTQTSDSLMTETLAKVYLQQKNYQKALQAYKILILKYPQKSGFFADQIRAIKKLINTRES